MLVRSVGLSQPRELSSFSVDAPGLVDSPVEKGCPIWRVFQLGNRVSPGNGAGKVRRRTSVSRWPDIHACWDAFWDSPDRSHFGPGICGGLPDILRKALRGRLSRLSRRSYGRAVSWRRIVAILP